MFASWLNIYDVIDDKVNTIKQTWKKVIECSIIDNEFDYNEYKVQYRTTFGLNGRREISPAIFIWLFLLKCTCKKQKMHILNI